MRIGLTLTFGVAAITTLGNSHIETRPVELGKEVNVSTIYVEPNGSLWLGLDGQGMVYKESRDASPVFYNKLSGTLPTDVVLCHYRDSHDRLWFGSFGNGLFYSEHGGFVGRDSLPSDLKEIRYVSSMTEDANGTFWISTLNSGLYAYYGGDDIRHFTESDSRLPTNNLLDLTCGDGRHLYIATSWGLVVMDIQTGQISPVRDDQGHAILEKQMIRHIYQKDSTLWVGTHNGLFAYHPATSHYGHIGIDDGLPGSIVRAISSDHQGHIWISTDQGIGCLEIIRQQGKPDSYQCLSYPTDNSMTFHVRAIACEPDGKMLFGTSKGLLRAWLAPGEALQDKPLWISSPILWNTLILVIFLAVVWWLYRRTGGFHRGRKKSPPPLPAHQIEPTPLSISSVDQQLIERATRIVEDNISDSDFSVEDLSAALGMSRGHLYKRLTALTGVSPLEFIRMIRLKRGKQYLDQSGEGVAQIAWKIGLSPKQFAKYFKEEYGMLPSEYVRQQQAD